VAGVHHTAQELEEARKEIDELKVELRAAETECEGLRGQNDAAEQRIQAANVARDQAIAERAVLEALFALVRKVLDEAQLPAAVLNPTRVERVKAEG
jgi:septal ring factor EnvC (AmiA/AmiB activator)